MCLNTEIHLPVFSQHEDPERSQSRQTWNLFNLVIIKIQEDQSLEILKVGNPADEIVLKVEQP